MKFNNIKSTTILFCFFLISCSTPKQNRQLPENNQNTQNNPATGASNTENVQPNNENSNQEGKNLINLLILKPKTKNP